MNLAKSKFKTTDAANELARNFDFARPIEAGANAMGRVAAAADTGLPDYVDIRLAGKIWETVNRLRSTVQKSEWKGFADDMLTLERTLIQLREKERK